MEKNLYKREKTNYKISNYGRVYNTFTNRFKKSSIAGRGYLYVSLYINNKNYTKAIHRLVGEYFVKNNNSNKYKVINHKDGNKLNNYYKNLEWCTQKYNVNHAFKYGLNTYYGENALNNKYSAKMVEEICELLQQGFGSKYILNYLKKKGYKILSSDKVFKKYINKIKNHRIWKSISKKYNF